MKASLFLAGASAILAAASPIRAKLNERALETEWVYETVTILVTAGQEAVAEPTAAAFLEVPEKVSTQPQPAVTQEAPKPKPKKATKKVSSSKAKVEPVVTQEAPKAEPTTTTKEVVQPATTEAAAEAEPTVVAEEAPEETKATEETTETADLSLDNDYKTVMVEYHNIHRRNHSAPDIEWDDTLAGYALNTANSCVFEHDMDQGNGGYGQNLATWGSTGDIDNLKNKAAAGGITNQWYNSEMANWSFYGQDNPPEGMDILLYGHFTQVVWKESTKVGCATVKCAAGTVLSFPAWYTVCNYNPQGNFGGEYGNNVLEPKHAKRVTV